MKGSLLRQLMELDGLVNQIDLVHEMMMIQEHSKEKKN